MKHLLMTLSVLMMTTQALADATLVASADRKARWSTEQVDSDALLLRRACIASIDANKTNTAATLEVVTLLDDQQSTLASFVRVSAAQANEFFGGTLSVVSKAGSQKFELSRGTFEVEGGNRVALGLIADRAALIAALKAGSRADVTLTRGTQKAVVASFSLSGSTAALDALKKCK